MNTIENTTTIDTLKMNPLSFIQMSGGINYLVYGFIVPSILAAIGFLFLENGGIFVVVLAAVMGLASFIRRGMDAGQTPLNALLIWGMSSWVLSEVMFYSGVTFKLMFMSNNILIGAILVALMQNIYLVILLFLPHKEMKEVKTSKTGQRVLLGITVILILGIVAAVVIPKFA